MNIEEKLKLKISEHLIIKKEEITDESDLVNDLGADSLDIVEFTVWSETEFDIEFTNEDADKLFKFKDIVRVIKEKIK